MIDIICCAIFKPELQEILPSLERELKAHLNCDQNPIDDEYQLHITYIPAALHDDNNKLLHALSEELVNTAGSRTKTVLLYGSMCHPDMCKITAEHNCVCFTPPNCIDVFMSKEKKQSFEKGLNVHFMTAGWIAFWKDIFSGENPHGWDPITARMNLGVNDKIIILDSGCVQITDEDILEIFDYIQLPVEVEKLDLDYFKKNVLELCLGA
ncbi:MAG: hypothetical protein Ta2B_03850 [Termitinemataceae bacterium]|nr:MAG: hypothetical protein Ta2B_03850 [Termitinemataceae bacterium]